MSSPPASRVTSMPVTGTVVVGGPLGVLLAAAGAGLLADAALRPVERMKRDALGVGEHESDRRLTVPATGDEVAALASTLNDVFDRLHSALHRERRFVVDASRELLTPLTTLRTDLELAVRPGRTAKALRAAIGDAGEKTDRLISFTEDLLLLARADNHESILSPEPIELRKLLSASIQHGRVRDYQPPVMLDCSEDLRVFADADRLSQLVDNLLDNAVQHSPTNTPVHVSATRDQHRITIEVTDLGPGLPHEFPPNALDPFPRHEAARFPDTAGTGLGLSIVRAIARAHGGSADIANHPDGGTRATVQLPMLPPVTGSGTAGQRPMVRPLWPTGSTASTDPSDPGDEVDGQLTGKNQQ